MRGDRIRGDAVTGDDERAKVPYQDRYKGRKIKDPPSHAGRLALFLLVAMAFAGFVGTLRGRDSHLCALATVMVVAIKLVVDLLQKNGVLKLPEKLTGLPLAAWLLIWLVPVIILFLVLKQVWPADLDPEGLIGMLSLLCLILYAPTLMSVIMPHPSAAPGEGPAAAHKEAPGGDKEKKKRK